MERDFSKTFICDIKIDRKYKTFLIDFKDESHYENFVDFIQERGGEVIGILAIPAVDINYIKKQIK